MQKSKLCNQKNSKKNCKNFCEGSRIFKFLNNLL